jgi:hypothetical protein
MTDHTLFRAWLDEALPPEDIARIVRDAQLRRWLHFVGCLAAMTALTALVTYTLYGWLCL